MLLLIHIIFSNSSECDQSKERMLEILEDRGLSFMFPLLHVQSDLWKQINQNPNPTAIYKWIKENCSATLYTDPKFISIVFTKWVHWSTSQDDQYNRLEGGGGGVEIDFILGSLNRNVFLNRN